MWFFEGDEELFMFVVYCCSLHKSITWKVLFILQQNAHTKKFWLLTDSFLFILNRFLYGSYLYQIWWHSNEQYSSQMHLSNISFSSSEIFQHCQAFVKHGQNLCHLLFILANQRCAEVIGTPTHFHASKGKLAVTCTFQDKEYPLIERQNQAQVLPVFATHAGVSFV